MNAVGAFACEKRRPNICIFYAYFDYLIKSVRLHERRELILRFHTVVVRSPFNLWWWCWRWCGLIDHNTNYDDFFLSYAMQDNLKNKQHFTLTHIAIDSERIKKEQIVEFYYEKKRSLSGNTNKSVVRLLIILSCVCRFHDFMMIYNE